MRFQDKKATIGEVVVELPKATEVFKEFGIDFCCGGHRNLEEVIVEQKIEKNALFEKLEKLFQERKSGYKNQGSGFEQMNNEALTTYIEDTHHVYMRGVLPELSQLLNTLIRVHGKNHSELFELYRTFGLLKTDLEQHLLKEETMLFPDLKEAEENKQQIIDLTQTIISEHEAAGELLEKMRVITKNYQVPKDACNTYIKAYRLLEEMEDDLHQHIHLENNILLKEYAKH